MSLESNDSFIRVSLKEISVEDPFYETLQKLVDHLQISLVNVGSSDNGISIIREEFVDAFVGSYAIKENGSGITVGLFKNTEGNLVPISFSLPNEIKLVQGSEIGEFVPPKGWKISEDPDILRRYAIGTSPNYKVAPIVYVGI